MVRRRQHNDNLSGGDTCRGGLNRHPLPQPHSLSSFALPHFTEHSLRYFRGIAHKLLPVMMILIIAMFFFTMGMSVVITGMRICIIDMFVFYIATYCSLAGISILPIAMMLLHIAMMLLHIAVYFPLMLAFIIDMATLI